MKCLPGDPFSQEQALPKEVLESLRKHYGLDKPWYVQYGYYLKSILTWNLGPSLVYPAQTVNDFINKGFPISAALGIEALSLSLPIGIALGALAALYHNRWQDHLAMVFALICISIPSFLLATLLQYLVAVKLSLLPVARWESFWHSLLPAISLAALPTAFIARIVRSNMLEVLQQDYIKAAKAKGLTTLTILMRHALPNVLLPVLPYLGQLTANVLVGSFVIERIFAIPGLGQWFVLGVANRDYTMIMGTTVFYSIILLSTMLLVDILYALLNPRIRQKIA